MKTFFSTGLLGSLLPFTSLSQSNDKPKSDKEIYENYSFDFSAHTKPLAYTTIGNAVELVNKVKVNVDVADRGGAYMLDTTIDDKEFEIELEFKVWNELEEARGFMVLLTQQEMLVEEFMESHIGYRQDYEGIGVYVFRHPGKDNAWQVMTLQN